jgi:precorrin-2 dehydrogenase/sirohydrochlorin ferrochelatase
MQTHFPIVLDLSGKACLVVGGGEVATRKIESLLQARAEVTVIAPAVSAEIAAWAEDGNVKWRQEPYTSQEVQGYSLVIAATDQADVNLAVWRAVNSINGWINIVDRPDLCNFIVPSVVQRGKLLIAVSTSGASPGLSRKIRRQIEQDIGPEYESYVEFLAAIRQQVMMEVVDPAKRKEIFRRLLDESYVEADEETRYQMAAVLIQQQGRQAEPQGGNHETLESRHAQKYACADPNQLGD